MTSILLLDDEELVAETLARQLAQMRHAVTVANDGSRGFRLFLNGRFDLVISDIFMPEEDGLGFIMAARRYRPEIPIVAITGHHPSAGCDYLAMAAELGAAATIRKPIRSHQLRAVVDWTVNAYRVKSENICDDLITAEIRRADDLNRIS